MNIRQILTAVTFIIGTLVVPAPAHAADHRPCVSKTEFWARYHYPVQDRKTIEARWEVARTGRHAHSLDTRTTYVLAYRACDYSRHEVKVFVQYQTNDNTEVAALWWRVH